jgi:CheY-like chemotaxis protein
LPQRRPVSLSQLREPPGIATPRQFHADSDLRPQPLTSPRFPALPRASPRFPALPRARRDRIPAVPEDRFHTWLALDGAVVDQAHSVATARAALVKKPDIVLLDVHLDDEHSYELAAEVLSSDAAPAVVVMSGAATDLDRRRFEALGISAYLSKPFCLDDISRIVDGVDPDQRLSPPVLR